MANTNSWASWRTLTFGLIGAIGAAVTAAYVAGIIEPDTLPKWVKGIAGLMTVIGTAGTGFVARDDKVTSENAGAVIDPHKPVVNVTTGEVKPAIAP